jgi:drug/metabolite transporter (DMT)-like permease
LNALSLILIALSECCSIAGQVLFKIAMGHRWDHSRRQAVVVLGGGVAVMALGFFIWLGLLSSFDLSLLYPFEGLNRIVLLVAAAFFLKEKITPALAIGVVLIGAGVVLVATS